MSEPSYEQVTNDVLLNNLYHKLEPIQYLKREPKQVSALFRRGQELNRENDIEPIEEEL